MRMLVLDRLTKRFGEQTAVDGLSLQVPAGQIVGLLGPNGAGKTTTLKMVTGLLKPDAGTAIVAGFDIVEQPLEAKRVLGFVPDSGAVYESLTGLEYLLLVAALYGIEEGEAVSRIARFIDFFELGMDTLEGKLLGAYSKGMRRKVVITAALLHHPQVVFLDEPLDGLDANAAVGFKALLETLAREGKTIVYSSHILDVVERVCHRVAIIHQGRLMVDGPPDELIRQHQTASLEQLFTQITGAHDHEERAETFARAMRP
jgi:ABC-2 type transport system ATP-binding protein